MPDQKGCVGLLCRIFGHKFATRVWHNGGNPYCYRCGYELEMSPREVARRVPDPCAGCSGCSRCYDANTPR